MIQPVEWILFALGALLTLTGGLVVWKLFKPKGTAPVAVSPKIEATPKTEPSAQTSEVGKALPTSVRSALSATQKNFWERLRTQFLAAQPNEQLQNIEEVLYTSDLGPKTVELLLGSVSEQLSHSAANSPELIKDALKHKCLEIFSEAHIAEPGAEIFAHLDLSKKPSIWLIVGVNGAGKTTSIGKLAAQLSNGGKRVLVAAGDTFRAAANSQLQAWTERAKVEFFSPPGVTEPSAVAFQALQKGKDFDIVLIDTAGRLHTQTNLMEELKKIKRVLAKIDPTAPHETLIVLDANSGQNALAQAQEFHAAIGLTGVILTKMDGTAKGGVAVGLAHELKIPIRLIGIGEKLEDLRPFSSQEFVDSIF